MSASHQPGAKLALQNGNWVMALAEYTISPHWYFTVFDEYNYGNADPALQVHYPVSYTHLTLPTSDLV